MLKIGIRPRISPCRTKMGILYSWPELLTKGPVLLYFYPADFTPVCTQEACAFDALAPELSRAGVTLLGVSPQDSARPYPFP